MAEVVGACEGLDVGYEHCEVVAGLNLSFAAGEIVALLGPNGSGKSTILKTFAGLLRPIRGRVLLGSADAATLSVRERAHRVAYVPQEESFAFRFTVAEVVAMGCIARSNGLFDTGEDREAATRAMATADCTHLAGRIAADLSGGEKQRVLIARAIAQEVPLVLLDEPTAHMDPEHQVGMIDLVNRLAGQGKAVILALHDLNLAAAMANRALLIGGRRVVAEGLPRDVLASSALDEVYRVAFERSQGRVFPISPRRP